MKTALTTNNNITTYNVSMSASEAATVSGELIGSLLGKNALSLIFAQSTMSLKEPADIVEVMTKMREELIAKGHSKENVSVLVEFIQQIYIARRAHISNLPEGTTSLS